MRPNDGYLSLLTFSGKRKDLLFFIHESPKTLEEIRDKLDVKTPEIVPHLKKMESANLIIKQDGLYSIAPFGEVLASYYKPLLDAIAGIESNCEFWDMHDISGIPRELLFRITDLKGCKTIVEDAAGTCVSHKEFVKNVQRSEYFKGAACMFIPSWIGLFSERACGGIPLEIIVTPSVFEHIQRERSAELERLLKNKNAHIYVGNNLKESFGVTDQFFSLSLTYKTVKHHDTINDLMGFDLAAIKWGNDLFEYHKENSVEIKSIEPLNEAVIPETRQQPLLI